MAVRLENRGPFAIYRFERGSTQRVTLELPAIVLPPPLPKPKSAADAPESQPAQAREPL